MIRRSLQIALLLFGGLLSGQVKEYTIPAGPEHAHDRRLVSIDSLEPGILELGFDYHSYLDPQSAYTWHYKALYYYEQDSLGPIKWVHGLGIHQPFPSSFNNLVRVRPHAYISTSLDSNLRHQFRFSQLANNQPFLAFSSALSAGSWNYHGEENLGFLSNCDSVKSSQQNYAADTLYLSQLKTDASDLGLIIRDTFALPFSIHSPGIFIYHDSSRMELFVDQKRLLFNKSGLVSDSILEISSAYYLRNKDYRNHQKFINGELLRVADSLDAKYVYVRRDRFGNLDEVQRIYLPQSRPIYIWEDQFAAEFQPGGIVNNGIHAIELGLYILNRMKGEQVLQQSVYRPQDWSFCPQSAYSFADGTFLLGGYIETVEGQQRFAHLVRIGPWSDDQAQFERNLSFQISFHNYSNTLRIFYEGGTETIHYRVTDIQGREIQSGECPHWELLQVKTLSRGVYHLQLWDSQNRYLGQRSFVKSVR